MSFRRFVIALMTAMVMLVPLAFVGSSVAARLPRGCVLKPHGRCAGANLAGRHLNGKNLAGINLAHANLTGATLQRTNLAGANLRGANLHNANLRGTNLAGANLRGANLKSANLSRLLRPAIFTNLSHANLSHANLSHAVGDSVIVAFANVTSANLTYAKLGGANLSHANFGRSNLAYANLNATLVGADFSGANLSHANFSTHANLSGANLSHASLAFANLTHANLTGANFTGSNLHSSALRTVDVTNARFTGADMSAVRSGGIVGTPAVLPPGWAIMMGYAIGPDANLTRAQLTNAYLANANLTRVNLTGATLTGVQSGGIVGTPSALPPGWAVTVGYLVGPGANLNSANLANANLSRVNLTGATMIGVQSGGIVGTPSALPPLWSVVNGYLIGPSAPPAPQAIIFRSTAPTLEAFGGPTYTPVASSTSGLVVTLTIDPTSITVCSISPLGVVSIIGAGTCTIDANQLGNVNWNPAAQVQQAFLVAKGVLYVVPPAAQSLAFGSPAPVLTPSYYSDAGHTVPVTPTLLVAPTCGSSYTASSPALSVLTVACGGTAGLGLPGTDPNYTFDYSAMSTITVTKGTQAVAFTSIAPAATVAGPTYTPAATATSGLAVTITVDPSSSTVCSMTGSVVSFALPGTCLLDANQLGNTNWNAALQVQQVVNVGKGTQTVTFTSTPPSPATVASPPYTPTATASSGLAVTSFTLDPSSTGGCTVSNGTFTFTAAVASTCVIDANQAGDNTWNPATAKQTINVN